MNLNYFSKIFLSSIKLVCSTHIIIKVNIVHESMFKYFVFVFWFLVLVEGRRRWHTSQTALIKLYDLQKEHFNVMNGYLNSEMKRLEDLEKTLTSVHEWNRVVTNNDTYLHIHINGILTMNRISQYMRTIVGLVNNEDSMAALKAIDEDSDLSGDHIPYTIQGLRRLQRFYDISASEMASGRYMEQIIGDEINVCECYVIAKHCFENDDMGGALDWGVQTYEKWMNSGYPKCVNIENLDFYIVASSVFVGFDYRTLFDQNYPYAKNIEKFTQYFSLMSAEMNLHDDNTLDIFNSYQSASYDNANAKFKALCKYGKSSRTLTKDSQCRYQTRGSSYRILMPFKEEDVDSFPYIKIYHDVLYDGEIQNIKTLVMNGMYDAKVMIGKGLSKFSETSRSGQVNWIDDGAENFELIDVRVKCLTDLSLKSAESYQIVNYGLCGHYVPHHDAFHKHNINNVKGNRLATVLFYMSDVPNQGYTVFPMRDIVVPVKKGSAIVWFGLHSNNGDIIDESLHGSCPILKGNKWIMTKWFYEEGQFLSYDWTANVGTS